MIWTGIYLAADALAEIIMTLPAIALGFVAGAATGAAAVRRADAGRDAEVDRLTEQITWFAGSADRLYADNQRLHRRLNATRAGLRRAIDNRTQRPEAS
jgi:hypothetical protein